MGVHSMWTVAETSLFTRTSAQAWDIRQHDDFIDWIALNPHAGDLIPGGEGLRKVRWFRPGMGKRGGSRVIYYLETRQQEVLLLMVYAKAEKENLSPDFMNRLKEIAHGS